MKKIEKIALDCGGNGRAVFSMFGKKINEIAETVNALIDAVEAINGGNNGKPKGK